MLSRELSDNKLQIDCLDGLRGLAALIVVASHTSNAGMYFLPFLKFEGLGKSGVYLFFLISSFLLTRPLLSKGEKIFSFDNMSHYWQRRFFRIYPLYFIYLVTALTTTSILTNIFNKSDMGIPFSLTFSELINHLILIEGKGVTWSIAVEFKFYFILPFLVYIIYKLKCLENTYQILFLLICIVLTSNIFPSSDSKVNDISLLPYLPIFFTGILCAVIQESVKDYSKTFFKLISTIGIVGMILMTPKVFSELFFVVPNNFFHREFLMYTILWACILIAAINTKGILNKILCSKTLKFFGAISFSLYLFHVSFIKIFSRIEVTDSIDAWLVLLLASVLAYLSFRLIELPTSRFKIQSV